MKSNNEFRPKSPQGKPEEAMKKSVKLTPIRKSGKERHQLYSNLDEEEEDDMELLEYKKRDSILDYFDDGEEEEEFDQDFMEYDDDPQTESA